MSDANEIEKMNDSDTLENPYPESRVNETIRPRGIIRFGGGLIGILACIPTAMLLVQMATNPVNFVRQLDWTFSFILLMQVAFIWCTYRWFTISAKMDAEKVCLRGWFGSLRFPLSEFGRVQKIYYQAYSENLGSHEKWKYVVFDNEGEQLGTVPHTMQICRDWPDFLKKLNSYSSE